MSIDSVMQRVAEIEDRIAQVSAEPPARAAAPIVSAAAAVRGLGSGTGAAPVLPFNVALAEAAGSASLRPKVAPFAADVEALIGKYSAMRGLDPAVVRAVVRAESDGNPRAVSRAGARGLMQIMPGELSAYGISDPFDPEQNISAGTRQLADKLKLFNGDLQLALAAYNAGTGAVRKYGGVPPYPETQTYIKRIMSMLGTVRP